LLGSDDLTEWPDMVKHSTKISAHARAVSLTVLAAAGLLAAPALADVKAGVDAWSAGDYAAAVNEWRGPAQAGDADALFNMAQAYRLGRGVDADVDRARDLYAEAAARGHVKAADNYGLLLFQQGEREQAMPYIRAAADRGDPRAQYILGLAHFNADFAERDWVRAYALLTLAQSSGLPQAGPALAQMDQYVSMEDRQQAQVLARAIEAEANQRRSAQLAAADLGAPTRTPVAPSTVANARPSQPVPVPQAQRPAAQRPATQRTATQRSGEWRVQLGAFGVQGNAERLWAKLSGNPALRGTSKALVPAGRVTKLQAVGFETRADAQAACTALKQQGQACLVTKS
jgi:cell division septation protein DedD